MVVPAEDVCLRIKDFRTRNLITEDEEYYPIKST